MTVKELKELITDMSKVNFIDIVSGKQVSMPTNKDGSIRSNWEKLEIVKLQPSSSLATNYDGYTPMLNVYVDLKYKTLTLRELIDTMRIEFDYKKWEIRTFEKILYTNDETIGGSNILIDEIYKIPRDMLDNMIVHNIAFTVSKGGKIVVTVLPRSKES
jgi:hypothetical protein